MANNAVTTPKIDDTLLLVLVPEFVPDRTKAQVSE
jgi:hypothetical protein